MSLSSVELWQRISSAGLAAPMICRSWAAEALQGLPPSAATDADKILAQLVKIGRLTDYQADLIAGRRAGEFKRGAWTLLRPVSVPLWGGWFEATKSPTSATTWVRWLDSEALTRIRSAAPSLPRGLRLAQIQGRHLQSVLIPELIDKQLQLQVAPISGIPLSSAFATDSTLAEKANLIIHQVAEALSPLHAAGIAHGRVLPDRIYWDAETSEVTLARDPLCAATATLDKSAIGVIEQNLAGLAATQFMAPEFLTPGQLPTLYTDIYSLGCIWWWLVTGRAIVTGSTMEKQLARQAEATLALPKDCMLTAPFVRVLQHCLAKNISARFASADALVQALQAAGAVVAKGQVPRERPQPVRVEKAVAKGQVSASPALETAKPIGSLKPNPAENERLVQQLAKPVASVAAKTPPVKASPIPVQSASTASEEILNQATAARQIPPGPKSPVEDTNTAATVKGLTADSKRQVPAEPVRAKHVQESSPQEIPSPRVPDKERVPSIVSAEVVGSAATKSETTPNPPAIRTKVTSKVTPEEPAKSREQVQLVESKPAASSTLESDATSSVAASEKRSAKSIAAKSSATRKSASAATKRKVAKRQKANKWVLPVIGGFGFISLLLFILLLSGGLNFSGKPEKPTDPLGNLNPPIANSQPEIRPRDLRLDFYRIVSSGKDTLWAPPAAPKPLLLDLLPPGGQMFVSFHPKGLLTSAGAKTLLSALEQDVTIWLNNVTQRSGQPLESISHCTVAFYAENETPVTCLRIVLAQPQQLSTLKATWGATADEKIGTQTLLTGASGDSFYVAAQPLTDVQSVSEFSLGPAGLMREVAEAEGAAGPLITQMEKLWQASDGEADFSLLLAPSYLFSDGKSLLATAPRRLASQLTSLLGTDVRAALIQTRLEPQWYVETQLVGLQDRDTGRVSEELRQRILGASTAVEEWFVTESAHPYWRPLALRFPQMLRTVSDQARFGIENGIAIANLYLPKEAASNVLLASWNALQDGATLASDAAATAPTAVAQAAKPLTLDEYLGRSIKLSFDQEPIEVALKLVGDEANANLPAGTPPLRFELDGASFEKAGITRNQQLRDFKHVDKPVRDVLTAIAKRGNPVTTVTDTRDKDQRLIWVVRDDPQQAGQKLVSLTTRDAAAADSIPLTVEFAPSQ